MTYSLYACCEALEERHRQLAGGYISKGQWATSVLEILRARYPDDASLRYAQLRMSVLSSPYLRKNTATDSQPREASTPLAAGRFPSHGRNAP